MAVITAAPLTLEEFSKLPHGQERHELSAGELITMPPPKSLHSRVVGKIIKALERASQSSTSLNVLAEAGYILSRDPLTVRQPDVSVITTDRMRSTDPDDYFEGAPELAVEVVSPSDSAEDLQIKVDQYLQTGAKQVWVLYPKAKRVHVFYIDGTTAILDETQTLDGGDFMPGFAVKVADLFLSENHASA